MKYAISNIAWKAEDDLKVYQLMKQYGFEGLEIAPTRIFSKNPYDCISEAKIWKKELYEIWGFQIPSMQSIWYGRQEKIFESERERDELINYTKKAIDFANIIDCHNLVFGCPKNRNITTKDQSKVSDIAIEFFNKIGEYALKMGTTIGMEANPTIYNTNFINDTCAAIELIKKVDSKGFLLNLDVGTMIQNRENAIELVGNVKYINHVHISEPRLVPIEKRELHQEIIRILNNENYQGYVSVEMGNVDEIDILDNIMKYVSEEF